jgi:hypothetical protein
MLKITNHVFSRCGSSLNYVGSAPRDVVTNESIIEQTYCPENLPYPLFACPKTGKRYQRGGIPPFCKGRGGGIYSNV